VIIIKKDYLNLIIRYMDYIIKNCIELTLSESKVYDIYTKGKLSACMESKKVLEKLYHESRFSVATTDILNLVSFMEQKIHELDVKSTSTNNGLYNVYLKGERDIFSEVKAILAGPLPESPKLRRIK